MKANRQHLPVGFSPPVLVGMAPASPSAASPASGFLASPPTYIDRDRTETKKKTRRDEMGDLINYSNSLFV